MVQNFKRENNADRKSNLKCVCECVYICEDVQVYMQQKKRSLKILEKIYM